MDGSELDVEDAWRLLRGHGLRSVLVTAFTRFRYGDGFTNSRALALQACLAVVPFVLALTGLVSDIDQERPARVLARTIGVISPGVGDGDALATAADDSTRERTGEIALWGGLVVALVSLTMAMAQIERGLNRIYGIRRDRPAVAKYGRAAVLTAVLSLPIGLGFLLVIAGGGFAEGMQEHYGWSGSVLWWWQVLRWPLGITLLVGTIAVLLDHSPRRQQPALSWLALGAVVSVLLTLMVTAALAVYVHYSGSFGEVYGPLAGVFAMLLWAWASSVSFFYGAAVCAQLEALRAGEPDPALEDPGRPHGKVVAAGD